MCVALLVTAAQPLIQFVREQARRSPGDVVKCQVGVDRVCGVDEDMSLTIEMLEVKR